MRRLYRGFSAAALLFAVASLCACSSILPRAKEQTLSSWATYDEVQVNFDKIVPGETRLAELEKLGFDPKATPNLTRVTYITLLERFLPNQSVTLNDIDPAVSACLRMREACYGLSFSPGETDRKRYGNAFLDIFGFVRKTRITGWRFDGLVVIQDDLVVYKLAGGDPNIKQLESSRRPLGPLQEINVRGNIDFE